MPLYAGVFSNGTSCGICSLAASCVPRTAIQPPVNMSHSMVPMTPNIPVIQKAKTDKLRTALTIASPPSQRGRAFLRTIRDPNTSTLKARITNAPQVADSNISARG